MNIRETIGFHRYKAPKDYYNIKKLSVGELIGLSSCDNYTVVIPTGFFGVDIDSHKMSADDKSRLWNLFAECGIDREMYDQAFVEKTKSGGAHLVFKIDAYAISKDRYIKSWVDCAGYTGLDIKCQNKSTLSSGDAYQVKDEPLALSFNDKRPYITTKFLLAVSKKREEFKRSNDLSKIEDVDLNAIIEKCYDIPCCNYLDWVTVGAAIKTAFVNNDQQGLEFFHQVSSNSKGYKASDTNKKWRALRPGEVSIGVLFNYMKRS